MQHNVAAMMAATAGIVNLLYIVIKPTSNLWLYELVIFLLLIIAYGQFYQHARSVGELPGPNNRPRKNISTAQQNLHEARANYWRELLAMLQFACTCILTCILTMLWPQHNALIQQIPLEFLSADASYRFAPAVLILLVLHIVGRLAIPEHLRSTTKER